MPRYWITGKVYHSFKVEHDYGESWHEEMIEREQWPVDAANPREAAEKALQEIPWGGQLTESLLWDEPPVVETTDQIPQEKVMRMYAVDCLPGF